MDLDEDDFVVRVANLLHWPEQLQYRLDLDGQNLSIRLWMASNPSFVLVVSRITTHSSSHDCIQQPYYSIM